MLAAYVDTGKNSQAVTLLGANSLLGGSSHSNNGSFLFANSSGSGMDCCSFYNGPSDATIMSFGESGLYDSIAYVGGESCGSIAYVGGESCGSIASAGGDVSCSGGCDFSC